MRQRSKMVRRHFEFSKKEKAYLDHCHLRPLAGKTL